MVGVGRVLERFCFGGTNGERVNGVSLGWKNTCSPRKYSGMMANKIE